MNSLLEEQTAASRKGNLSKSLLDLQNSIDLIEKVRDSIALAPTNAPIALAKVQNPVRKSFEDINNDIKDIHAGLSKYSKALDKRFKDKPLPTASYDALSANTALISRAIGMHFLREGQFMVASTFLTESAGKMTQAIIASRNASDPYIPWENDLIIEPLRSEALRKQFGDMYHILDELKTNRNLVPAINWARSRNSELEARGSNLEFELGRLQFIWLFEKGAGDDSRNSPLGALAYARQQFGRFQTRYLREIQQLMGAMAFCPNLQHSPYRQMFHNESAWDDLAVSFTREFCSLLGLSADSPIYIAATAGAIALPTLQKLQLIMETKRTEWTTQDELPVELPLPPTYRFHSIFVCPVSKEQTTDGNPPMMMPCGHVVAQESLQRLSKISRFKCPYCPGESHPKDARKVFL